MQGRGHLENIENTGDMDKLRRSGFRFQYESRCLSEARFGDTKAAPPHSFHPNLFDGRLRRGVSSLSSPE
jgi:hypothetical protein